MIYPMFDQILNIGGMTLQIPAWRRFISNNSYKFSQKTVAAAANYAGLNNLGFFQKGPIALFVTQKP